MTSFKCRIDKQIKTRYIIYKTNVRNPNRESGKPGIRETGNFSRKSGIPGIFFQEIGNSGIRESGNFPGNPGKFSSPRILLQGCSFMMGEPYRSFIPSIFQRLHRCLQLFQMMPRHIGTDLEKYPINKNTSMIHLRYIYDTYMIHISMIHL